MKSKSFRITVLNISNYNNLSKTQNLCSIVKARFKFIWPLKWDGSTRVQEIFITRRYLTHLFAVNKKSSFIWGCYKLICHQNALSNKKIPLFSLQIINRKTWIIFDDNTGVWVTISPCLFFAETFLFLLYFDSVRLLHSKQHKIVSIFSSH